MLLTLPSNVIDKENSENSNSSYTTVLPSPVTAQPGEYELGLSEIQYTKTWNNVTGCEIAARYTKVDGTLQTITKKLRNGRYSSHKQIVHEIGRLFAGEKFQLNNGQHVVVSDELSVLYAKITSECAIRTNNPNISVKITVQLGHILGISSGVWLKPASETGNVCVSTERPDIDAGMTALFVYCDIISPRCVGGDSVRLLRAVTIPHETSHTNVNVVREFKYTHYIDVDSGSHRTIRIDICRDNGEKVPFEGGKVIVTLHMRRK